MALPEDRLEALALLTDPVRHRLYRFVVSQDEEVTRHQAAQAVGISRSLAAYHLDRMVEEGLLVAGFAQREGGPGAGRPAKVYRASEGEVAASVPPRDYRLLARVMAGALAEETPEGPSPQVARAARETGRRLAEPAAADADLADLEALLGERGFDPLRSGGEIVLRNCPFHALVQDHRQLVCGMNLHLVEGLLEGFGIDEVQAVLAPRPDACCVVLRLGSPGRSPTSPDTTV